MTNFRNIGPERDPVWVKPSEVKAVVQARMESANGWIRKPGWSTVYIEGGAKLIIGVEVNEVLRRLETTASYVLFNSGRPSTVGVTYPTRARIIDVTGVFLTAGGLGEDIELRTPDTSKEHIGKEGLAERVDGNVRLTLDDGTTLWGFECWWEPIEGEG